MDAPEHTVMWRRLDEPGHDTCGLWRHPSGWRLAGAAVFRAEGRPCQLRYAVDCDGAWRTRSARVDGWLGASAVDLAIAVLPDGRWTLGGVEQPGLSGLVDVDLGFTPSTNLLQLRRLALPVGEGAPAPVAYLSFPELRLGRLDQTYRCAAELAYDYESPRFGYAGRLRVDAWGFVTHYPGLWELEPTR